MLGGKERRALEGGLLTRRRLSEDPPVMTHVAFALFLSHPLLAWIGLWCMHKVVIFEHGCTLMSIYIYVGVAAHPLTQN